MLQLFNRLFLMIYLSGQSWALYAQPRQTNIDFIVSMTDPAAHSFQVVMTCRNLKKKDIELKMCAWTPGDYRIHNYQAAVSKLRVTDQSGKEVTWEKASKNSWRVHANKASSVVVTYDVKADTAFIVNEFVDQNRGIITPAGLCLYTDEQLKQPVTIEIKPYSKWNQYVATGLDPLPGKKNIFYAADFDILFDSPFLLGNLEILPSFTIKGIPHYFVAYGLGQFDRNQFMGDLKKVVQSGVDIIGDIPYDHYTFMDIGQGGGGIEHLNSTLISFRSPDILASSEVKKRNYSFLAHEYFHHYNIKRIRPIALGPFDYSQENYTRMLWVSEGITEYYAQLMVRHAGLVSDEELLSAYQGKISSYENKPGHRFQSATQASYDTWHEWPFGKTEAQLAKTISYYDKGCALGLLLDFKIRHESQNRRSLDDVMRILYTKYYKTLKRGFTDKEFQMECEKMAGAPLTELFDYASTTKEVNYPKYFAYAGLSIDTLTKQTPYLGIIPGVQMEANVVVNGVEKGSPAGEAGLQIQDKILTIDGKEANLELLNGLTKTKKSGQLVKLTVLKDNQTQELTIKLGSKYEKSFAIKKVANPNALQAKIYTAWLNR